MKKSIMAALLLAGAVAAPFQSKAASQLFELDAQFNGFQTPGSTLPWLTATFTDASPGVVLLTLNATSLYPGAYVTEFDFNFSPNSPLNLLSIATTNGSIGSVTTTSINKGTNAFQLNGTGGQADINFNFATTGGGQFTAGEQVVYALSGVPGLNASMFNYFSVNATSGPWLTAARVAGVPCPDCGASTIAWIGDCTGTPNNTPEPATMAILGSFIAFGVYLKRRSAKSVTA